MTIHLATDHAGFALKEEVKQYLQEVMQLDVHDWGAMDLQPEDDYPHFIAKAAQAVAATPQDKAVIFGGSGQGEAMVANRFAGVRATVFYGDVAPLQVDENDQTLSIIEASRLHNNANVLSLGARYVSAATAKSVIETWLSTPYNEEERHERRISLIDTVIV